MFNIVTLAMRLLRNRDRLPGIRDMLDQMAPEPEPEKSAFPVGSVEWLQESLNQLSPSDAVLEVDGKYGPATRNAVLEYQQVHDLKTDGWAGPETVASIIEELAKVA